MEIYGYVYLVRNRINGKIYVGQSVSTLNKRWRRHLSTARNKRGYYIHAAIRKYGEGSFDLVELHRAHSEQELHEMEIRSILVNDACNPDIGYNLTEGGQGGKPSAKTRAKLIANSPMRGKKHTEETRKKMREAPRPPVSDATRQKRSARFAGSNNPRFGAVLSDSTKKLIGDYHRGTKRTSEVKAKLSAIHTLRLAPVRLLRDNKIAAKKLLLVQHYESLGLPIDGEMNWQTGRVDSEETKRRRVESSLNRKKIAPGETRTKRAEANRLRSLRWRTAKKEAESLALAAKENV